MKKENVSPPFKVQEIGEIAVRCSDLDRMESFYHQIIGLPYLAERDRGIVFFKIADGFEGHPQVLALFEKNAGRQELHETSDLPPATGGGSSLHHIALCVSHVQQNAAIQWFEENGLEVKVQVFEWIGWRGVFVKDPEGNTVELVSNNPILRKSKA